MSDSNEVTARRRRPGWRRHHERDARRVPEGARAALCASTCSSARGAAQESSDAWNNAGTGHAANCELNYTPERADGSVDISKALEVNVEFDLSRQFWSYLVKKGAIADPRRSSIPCRT